MKNARLLLLHLALIASLSLTACRGGVPLAVEAMRAGATDFLEKPLLDARLLQKVRLALKQ